MLIQPPENYAETGDGLLLVADGWNPMQRWDGVSTSLVPAGTIAPASAPTLAGQGSGTISGTYYGYVRFVDDLGNVSDLSPVSTGVTVAAVGGITYSSVPTSTQSKVTRRQLLRNTAGQAQTFYVEIDTTDLSSSSFTGTLTDGILGAQIAVPLFDTNGDILANTNGVPPSWKAVVAAHLGRMFAAVERDYVQGGVVVTNGSTLVQGINTNWPASFVGRLLYVVGGGQGFQISAVDTVHQTLTLLQAYNYPSDAIEQYAIRPPRAERRLVYYTQAGLPESWPPFNALQIQEDGDELTGLMPMGSFIYILETRHIYRFTFQSDPGQDGFVFLSSIRGCLNNRCWVTVEDSAYMLDYSGIHQFTEGQSVAIGAPIQQIFVPYTGAPSLINWNAAALFHASHSPAEEVIRWFVCLSGEYAPRHAIALDYRNKRWWLEEFQRAISCNATSTYEGRRRVFFGSDANTTLLYQGSPLDGPDPGAGQTAGTVTSASLYRLTDTNASWPSAGVVGAPVVITGGTGEGQVRRIYQVQGTTLWVIAPWSILPDTTSTYQIGGIPWEYQSGWFRYLNDEDDYLRRVEVVFEPTAQPANCVVNLYEDFSQTPLIWHRTFSANENEGMAMQDGSGDLLIDLTLPSGFAQQRYPGHKELNVAGSRYLSVRVAGVANPDFQAIYQIVLDGCIAE